MGFRYEWREISDDGLLQLPIARGFPKENVNYYGGFDTEEEACRAYDDFAKERKYQAPYELVLLRIYKP
jgi:hypothetical protein